MCIIELAEGGSAKVGKNLLNQLSLLSVANKLYSNIIV